MNETDCLAEAMHISIYAFSAFVESRVVARSSVYRPLPWQRTWCRRTEKYQVSHSTLPNVLLVVMHH